MADINQSVIQKMRNNKFTPNYILTNSDWEIFGYLLEYGAEISSGEVACPDIGFLDGLISMARRELDLQYGLDIQDNSSEEDFCEHKRWVASLELFIIHMIKYIEKLEDNSKNKKLSRVDKLYALIKHSNECYSMLIPFKDLSNRTKKKLTIDIEKNTYQFSNLILKPIGKGYTTPCNGFIGLYDLQNLEHIENMLFDAQLCHESGREED